MSFLSYIKSRAFVRTALTLVVLTVLILFLLGKWLNMHTRHDQVIQVPDLLKMSLEETEKTLKEADLRFVVIDSASFNPDFPPQSVIEQDPRPGDRVKQNRKIYLTLNPSNYRKVTIPNVLDQTKRQVVTQLRSVGFVIGGERYIPDLGKDVVRKLEIKGKEIKPGDRFPKNTQIDLVLGDGLEERDSL